MKAVFIQARETHKVGDVVDLKADAFETLAASGIVVTASEYAMIVKQKEDGTNAIKAAIVQAKAIGAIEPKDTSVEEGTLARFNAGASANLLVELIQAKYGKGVEDSLAARQTTSVTDGNDNDGPVARLGYGAVKASLSEELTGGYVKAREPMSNLIRAGKFDAAVKISRDSADVLREHVLPIYARGEDFSIKNVVKAADNVDPSVGTLATGIVLMRNLGFLKNKLTFLNKISTDLRNEPILFGQNVLTRYITPPSVLTFVPGIGMTSDANTIANWKATITATNPAGTPQTSGTQTLSSPSATDVSVVMNNYKGVEITFNELTLASTMRNLFAEQQAAQFYALAEQLNKEFLTTMFNYSWNLLIAAQNAGLSINGASASLNTFGLSNVITIKNAMTLNKFPDTGRFVLLHSSYHDAILTDTNLLTAKAILSLIKKDTGAFEDGELPPLFNLSILESQLAAATGTGAAHVLTTITNPSNIPAQATTIGFAGNASSGLFVARIPQDYTKILGEIPATAALEIITEPDSGLSMLVTKRVDHNLQATFCRGGLMYNFAGGDPRQGMLLLP